MHITKQYIKMCSQANFIQEKWFPQIGDYYWLGEKYLCIPESCRIITNVNESLVLQYDKQDCVWLPQVDQVFDLFNIDISTVLNNILLTKHVYKNKNIQDILTLEELTLCTLMLVKKNKIWTNSKWVYTF